jgi:hypothetical protein
MKCKEIPRKQTEPSTITSYGYFDDDLKIDKGRKTLYMRKN